ncbi:glycosyltransferase family 4 protein [Roseinatronobacter sp.]|uniref:glycosyltransferase family 4 protein n=1 Tax=Roseinatronobacter sp. TaxID=1945755 RepID=UPI003F6F54E2
MTGGAAQRAVAFALPGDIHTRSGGTHYDRRVIESLRACGQPVQHVALPASWPAPSADDTRETLARLHALPAGMPLIIDGLTFGAMQTRDAASLNRPVIVMLHHPLGLETGLAPARAAELIARETANLDHAQHIIVPSGHIGGLLQDRFGVDAARITVAPPGFDRTDPAPPPLPPMDPPLILSVGLICPRKGHDILLRALGQVTDLNWQSVIVGMVQDMGYLKQLEDLRHSLTLQDRVLIAGELSQAALSQYYRCAHIFALATRYEGYGIVLGEAQLHSLPVVSCDSGAVGETLHGAGLLVPPDDPDAFAHALRDLLSDKTLYDDLSRKSHLAGTALPCWQDTAQIFRQVLARYITL